MAEVARLVGSGEPFDSCMANFLDEFYASPDAMAFEEEPPLLGPTMGEPGRLRDAFLAAAAEELARAYDFSLPRWVAGEARELRCPWFASPLAALRAVLILESPPAFRARNLFVSENALARA